uniref:Uncharacterized protein n=1 Tax=Echinococcus granulosus TaxID=6210 RepID=A0A068WF83_ECHGR|nr:hypothetical protein EgrG_000983100 [Echinococcus granulosus]
MEVRKCCSKFNSVQIPVVTTVMRKRQKKMMIEEEEALM